MIKLQIGTDWNICTPNLFRFLEQEHVDSFFDDGSLRISSFSQFHKHENEQRLDKGEGRTFFVHRTNQGGGQTINCWATHGTRAYILCAAMRFDDDLMKSFGCSSYFRITDTTKFGIAVARHIPGLIAGFEGPCLYQEKKIVEQDLGYINIDDFKDEKTGGKISMPALNDFLVSKMEHDPLFLKDKSFSHQVEYRYVWIVRNRESDFIDIKVPEAIQFCERPNELTE